MLLVLDSNVSTKIFKNSFQTSLFIVCEASNMNDVMKDILNRKVEPIVVHFKILSYNVLGFMKANPVPPHPD